jgi:hypothetical protein
MEQLTPQIELLTNLIRAVVVCLMLPTLFTPGGLYLAYPTQKL